MHRRHRLAYFILAAGVAFSLTPLMVTVDARGQIVFSSNRDGDSEIYVMDADGGNLQRLTNNSDGDWDPSWSPDGQRIAFKSDRDGHFMNGIPTTEIYVMDADGRNQQNLTNNPSYDGSPSWSPDGQRIAFESDRDGRFNWEIYVMDINGNNQQNLTNSPLEDLYPSWSPDGKQIVFSSARDGHVETKFGITYEIYVMDADGGNEQRLTENRRYDFHPSWSPDGQRIVFTADRKGNFEQFEIYVMDADGGNEQRLTNNRVYDWKPSWSPDSKRIAFGSHRNGNADIFVMDADGDNEQRLTNNRHNNGSPAWLNTPFSVSPAGKKFTMWGRVKRIDR